MKFTDAPDNMESTYSMLPTYQFQVPIVNGSGTIPIQSTIALVLQWTIFLKSNFISAQIPSYLPSVQKKVSKLIGLCPYIQDIWEDNLTFLSSCVNWKIIVLFWVYFTNTRLNLPRHRHKSMNNKNHKNGGNIYDPGDCNFRRYPAGARHEKSVQKKRNDDERTNGSEENFTKGTNDNVVEARVSWEPLKR